MHNAGAGWAGCMDMNEAMRATTRYYSMKFSLLLFKFLFSPNVISHLYDFFFLLFSILLTTQKCRIWAYTQNVKRQLADIIWAKVLLYVFPKYIMYFDGIFILHFFLLASRTQHCCIFASTRCRWIQFAYCIWHWLLSMVYTRYLILND